MTLRTAPRFFLAVLCVLAFFAGAAEAQQAPTTTNASEIPARLRHLEGTVTVQRAAAGDTEAAVMNLPLGSGDRIWSAEDGRVEIMFEDGTTLWMDATTTLDFVSLPRPSAANDSIVRLWTGSVYVHRPTPNAGAVMGLRLDTPTGAVRFDEPGLFRLDLDEDQIVWLSAYDGSALLDAGGISERVVAGRRAVAEPGTAPSEAVVFNTSQTDDFGNWRDQRMAQYASTQQYAGERDYLPANVVSYAADLEPYGSWNYHPTYQSWYWKPYAAVAWSPYKHGRWVYTYGGWSWVPSASWGYVTTHYGRWQYGGGGWMWFPGASWAPASVHWYLGGGYVGWVPLNYYGRPAVSFGVYTGYGVNVSVNIGGGYGYGYYDYGYYGRPYYGYYGYGYYGGYRPCYGCGGYRPGRPGRPGHYPSHYPNYRGQAYEVGPIGSASGTGRVVKGRGYSSGLADAWTVVPAKDFETTAAGRVAVSRSALPSGLDQASSTRVSGTLRARRPATLVPTSAAAASTRSRQAVLRGGNAAPERAATSSDARALSNSAQRRIAAPRAGGSQSVGAQSNAANAVRRATTSTGAPRAVRTPGPSGAQASGAVRAATRAAPPARTATPTGSGRRAAARTNSSGVGRSNAPAVSSSARRATSRSTPPAGGLAPAAAAGATRYPSGRSTATGATRYPTSTGARPANQRAVAAPSRLSPSAGRRSAAPRSTSRPPTAQSAVRPPSTGRGTASPRSSVSRAPSAQSAVRAPVRAPSARVPSRGAPAVRPSAPGGRSAPAVRPPAGARPGGASGKPARRSAKPKGGS